jgi:hypothetical protein
MQHSVASVEKARQNKWQKMHQYEYSLGRPVLDADEVTGDCSHRRKRTVWHRNCNSQREIMEDTHSYSAWRRS